ncbi:elks delta-like protein [Angomonas deanei]|nr:elks delta-like protein [Angomonas deanei]|eukprot:EPY38355.1 elks delta-like protein [Angomonas deanei]
MRETSNDAQKRLTIVRLMSMLDELQNSLQDKVDGTTEEEEERPQELLKIIQELTRSRERTLSLVNKREREMKAIIELKKARAAELEVEADKNRDMLDQVNNDEILSVAQRIQKERRELIMQLKKEEEINNKLADTMKDVKYAAEKYPKDRNAALSADEARGTSANPEKEMAELRKRITAADAERRRLTLKTQEMKTRTEDGAADYTEQMTQLKREILTYQTECTRLEKEYRDLQNLCDSIGQTLQN